MAGQIIKRGENKYLVRVYLGREGGKKKYHNKTVNGNSKDAQKYLNKVLRERDLGELKAPTKELLGPYLERWLEISARPRLADSTYNTYEKYVKIYLIPEESNPIIKQLKAIKIVELDPMSIQEHYNELGRQGIASKTIRNVHGVLNSALNQAVKWGSIRQNPAAAVDLPKYSKREMKVLTPAQAARFMEEITLNPYRALFSLLLASGMRPGEALALRWSDIDEDKGRVSIQRALQKNGKVWSLEEPKTPRSRRSIPLPPSVMADLKEHKLDQLDYIKNNKPDDYQYNDLVFAGRTGEPLDHKNLYNRHFKKILQDAGLPSIRLYDLRHTCATLLLSAGENPKIVSERLGHASTTMTLDTYSHVLPDMQDRATAKLESMLFESRHTIDTQEEIEAAESLLN